MKDFRKNNFSKGGRGGFGGKRDFRNDRGGKFGRSNDRGFDRGQMFSATCSECGKQCEVPFRPTGEKPVYCKDCFAGSPFDQSKNFARKEYGENMPSSYAERATHAQPFVQAPDRRIDELKKQLEMVHTKLDRIIRTLETAKYEQMDSEEGEKVVETPKPAKKTATKKVVKKAASKKK